MEFKGKRIISASVLLLMSFVTNTVTQGVCAPSTSSNCCAVAQIEELTLTTPDVVPSLLAISSQGCLSLVLAETGQIATYAILPTCALTGPVTTSGELAINGPLAYSPSGACLLAASNFSAVGSFSSTAGCALNFNEFYELTPIIFLTSIAISSNNCVTACGCSLSQL